MQLCTFGYSLCSNIAILCTFGYPLCSYIAGCIKWRIGAMFIASQTPHLGIARVLVCEAVLLFTLSAGRRLAELELVLDLLLVQVCVPMSIAVRMYVMVCIVIGVYVLSVRGCICTSVWCVVCALCVCVCVPIFV